MVGRENHQPEMTGTAVSFGIAALTVLASILIQPGVHAAVSPIEFTLPNSDRPLDVDADGAYEYLVFNLGLRVNSAGWYLIAGLLYASSQPNAIASTTNLSFHDAGLGSVELWYQGGLINASGSDGPYLLRMYAYDHNYSSQFSESMCLTGSYLHDEFSDATHFESQLPTGDAGMDTDSDGLFNYLVVTIPIHVMNRDYYDIKASIATCAAENSTALMNETTGVVAMHVLLDDGIQMVAITFNGALFQAVTNVTAFTVFVTLQESGFEWPLFDDFTTHDYTGSQFFNPAASFSPPHSDWAMDIDGNRVMDYLAIGASVDVQVQGNYTVTGHLSIDGVVDIFVAFNRTYLDVGHHSVVLLCPGPELFKSRYNGTFQVELVLSDDSGSTLYSNLHETSVYYWLLFSSAPSPTITIQAGVDSTDEFVFNASSLSSDALVAGISEARWDWDGDGTWDTNWSTNLTTTHTFPEPGTYTVRLQVRDDLGRVNQTSITITVQPPGGRVGLILGENAFPFAALLAVSLVAVAFALLCAMPLEPLVITVLALLVPLFSRLNKDDALANYRRGMIHGFILAHPGISFSEMKASLLISSGSLVYHLEVLKKSGKIVSRKSGAVVRFYSADVNIPQCARLGFTNLQSRILRYLYMHGQATVREMSGSLSTSRQAVHNSLKKLEADRLVISVLYGPRKLYELASGISPDLMRSLSEAPPGETVPELPSAIPRNQKSPAYDPGRTAVSLPVDRPLHGTADFGEGERR